MFGRFVKFAMMIALIPCTSGFYFLDEDLRPWVFYVRAYSNEPSEKFPQLEAVGTLVVNETGKGFINRTSIFRDDYHFGASFCIVLDNRVFDADKQKARIHASLLEIQKLDSNSSFEIINPSDCYLN